MAWAEKWRIPFASLPYRFNLECLADFQLGSSSCCEWKIKQHIQEILKDAEHTDSGVLIAGDLEDEDRPTTRMIRAKIGAERGEVVRRDVEKHIAWLEAKVIPLLVPIHRDTKYGIMGGVAGHHWTQLTEFEDADGTRHPAINSVQYIYRRLEEIVKKPCVYLGEMVSFIDLTFESTYKGQKARSPSSLRKVGLLQHGEGGGATKAATLTKLERAAQGFDADFFIRGHDCQLVGTKSDQLFAKYSREGYDPSIMSKTKVMLNLGSATMGYEFRKGTPSYIEQAMMRPSTMGWGRIKFILRNASRYEDVNHNLSCDMKLEF